MGQVLVLVAFWTYIEDFLPPNSWCRGQHTCLFPSSLYFLLRTLLSYILIPVALIRTIPELGQAIKSGLNLEPGEKDDQIWFKIVLSLWYH